MRAVRRDDEGSAFQGAAFFAPFAKGTDFGIGFTGAPPSFYEGGLCIAGAP
jgi:hypothetical protein